MSTFINEGFQFTDLGQVEGERHMFKVNDGLSVRESLQWSDNILSALAEQLEDAGMNRKPLEGNSAWLAQLALEACRGVIQSVQATLETEDSTEKTTKKGQQL